MSITSIKGTSDILPPQVYSWQQLESHARLVFESFGFAEIRTPAFESTDLFIKSIGDGTDIVQKEMYTFEDRGKRSITLRPEGTAPVVRAYIEHNLANAVGLCKFYYMGPMFRAERPQKGRSRQFHQIGIESIGSKSPLIDIEAISAMAAFFKKIGLTDYELKINSIGCKEDKKRFGELLKKNLETKVSSLCEDCRGRLDKNVLRVLDCKVESCKNVVTEAPSILDSLCSDCSDHFEAVKINLKKLNIPFKIARTLVRGLDYYTGTVFEVTHKNLGSQDAIGAGGRYDNLVRDFGGPKDTGAFGFALGIERILLSLGSDAKAKTLDVFIAPEGKNAEDEGLRILKELRDTSIQSDGTGEISSEMDFEKKSLNAQMRLANKKEAKFVVILNDSDLSAKKSVVVRDMLNKTQEDILTNDVVKYILSKF